MTLGVQWADGDDGPDWGDLKHNEKEPEMVLKKVKEVSETFLFTFSRQHSTRYAYLNCSLMRVKTLSFFGLINSTLPKVNMFKFHPEELEITRIVNFPNGFLVFPTNCRNFWGKVLPRGNE
jgi:hypothetical protein